MASAITVAELYEPRAGGCHAAVAHGLLYTAGILPLNALGEVVGRGDPVRQAEQVFRNVGAVLKAAGVPWSGVARIKWFFGAEARGKAIERVWDVQRRYAAPGRQAGLSIFHDSVEPDVLVAVELIAAVDGKKHVVGDPSSRWARLVRVGDVGFAGGFVPRVPRPFQPGELFRQSEDIYAQLAAALKDGSSSLKDVMRVHQYVTRPGLDMGEFRRARDPFVKIGEFVSTSVVSGAGDPEMVGDDVLIKMDAELSLAPKEYAKLKTAWVNPGGLHAIKTGDFVFAQAQMSRALDGSTLHPTDLAAHCDQTLRNLDAELKGCGADWRNVVHFRSFLKDAAGREIARQVQRAWMKNHACPTTELVGGFFDPLALYEAEVMIAL